MDDYFIKLSSIENEVVSNTKKNLDATLADKYIYFCTSCKTCWEVTKTKWHHRIEYYDNFPSYKKKRKICERCTPDKNVEQEDES
jgi:transcription elongation factor Elf1